MKKRSKKIETVKTVKELKGKAKITKYVIKE